MLVSLVTVANSSFAKISSYLDVLAAEKGKGITHEQVTNRWKASSPVPLERLKVVTFAYVDFKDIKHEDGQVTVMDAVAPRVQKIFDELLARRFPIAKAKRIEFYEANDKASMNDNNTSAYNARAIIGQSSGHSLHAYGLAIDINPLQNPFSYSARKQRKQMPGLAEAVVDSFERNGFTIWGGNWRAPIDWQHFQTSRGLAQLLVTMTPEDAKTFFELHADHPKLMTELPASNAGILIEAYRQDAQKFVNIFQNDPILLDLAPKDGVEKFRRVWSSK